VHGVFYDFGEIDRVNVGRLMVYASLFFSITSAVGYLSLFAEAVEKKRPPA
jgi:CDP-diacylglycerol--glycerol-3-phosphate 3-phosphatidyltransferase